MLFDENLIFFDVNATDKFQLLSFIATKAEELGITKNRDGLLNALKSRENEFSTGLQNGFAIPHARCEYVNEPSIMYLKVKEEINWGTLDGSRVKCIFSLLVPEENSGNMHLQMLSKLATCLLEDEFKAMVEKSTDKKELTKYIYENMKEE